MVKHNESNFQCNLAIETWGSGATCCCFDCWGLTASASCNYLILGSLAKCTDYTSRFLIYIFLAVLPVFELSGQGSGGHNYMHRPGTPLKGQGQLLKRKVIGHGPKDVLMISGHMASADLFFGSFAYEHDDMATFHLITPPGMGGTAAAYPWPEQQEVFSSQWLKSLTLDLKQYIEVATRGKVYIIASWFEGMMASLFLADKYPDLVQGIMIAAPTIRAPFYRWYRPGGTEKDGKLFNKEARSMILEQRYHDFWKTVDEYTWHSNMFPAGFYSKNDSIAGRLKLEEARQPMVIVLRYFYEYMASDPYELLKSSTVPIHVLVAGPGIESWYQTVQFRGTGAKPDIEQMRPGYERLFQMARRDWLVEEKENIKLSVIDNSGLLVWQDKPEEFLKAFRGFIKIE